MGHVVPPGQVTNVSNSLDACLACAENRENKLISNYKAVDHVLVNNLKDGSECSAGNDLNLGERWGRGCLQDR